MIRRTFLKGLLKGLLLLPLLSFGKDRKQLLPITINSDHHSDKIALENRENYYKYL